jgi:hypothetical protein
MLESRSNWWRYWKVKKHTAQTRRSEFESGLLLGSLCDFAALIQVVQTFILRAPPCATELVSTADLDQTGVESGYLREIRYFRIGPFAANFATFRHYFAPLT